MPGTGARPLPYHWELPLSFVSIEFLALRNFQRHIQRVFRFEPGINTITGATDAGKSSIIRGLQWVALNRPSGVEFIRTEQKRADAIVCVEGRQVRRSRGSNVNEYKLPGKDALTAFGNEVPPQVVKVLQMGELNFQAQHDAPFWFSNGAGDVARQLNQVVDLGIIDDVLARIAARKRKAQTSEEICAERLSSAREKCRELEFAEELDTDLADAEQAGHALTLHQEREELFGSMIEKLERASVPIEVPDLSELDELKARVDSMGSRVRAFSALLDSAELTMCHESDAREELARTEKEIKQRTGGICPVCGKKL